MRAQQQQLRSRAQVAQPADAAADAAAADAVAAAAVAASTTTVIDPSAFSRSKLAPLTDGARARRAFARTALPERGVLSSLRARRSPAQPPSAAQALRARARAAAHTLHAARSNPPPLLPSA